MPKKLNKEVALQTFKELNIKPEILQSLDSMGFKKPTEIQEKAIPSLLNTDQDFVGQAQTGTGKTAAFVIPILQKLNPKSSKVQTLILTPTRELATQVEQEVAKLSEFLPISSTCIYGGSSYEKQVKALRQDKPQLVIGTPGRVLDLMKKKILKTSETSCCVLDEADEMLSRGFLEDVQKIFSFLKPDSQKVMFSATMPQQIQGLIKTSFNNFQQVAIKRKSLSNEDIDQSYYVVRGKHHKEALARLLQEDTDVYAIVFCKTRNETKDVGQDLIQRGYSAEILNGDMNQSERERVMKRFKDKISTILVCTDIAARGIDVYNLSHVINFGLPQNEEAYVHRIGRTGRAGLKGKAFTIINSKSLYALRRIEKHIKQKINYKRLPSTEHLKKRMVENEVLALDPLYQIVRTKKDSFSVDSSFQIFAAQYQQLDKGQLLKLMFDWKFRNKIRHFDKLGDIEEKPVLEFPRKEKRKSRKFSRKNPKANGRRPRRSRQ